MTSLLVLILMFAGGRVWAAGRVSLEGAGFPTTPSAPVAPSEARFDLDDDRRFELSSRWSFRFHPVVRATSAAKSWSTPAVLDPREFYFERENNGRFLRIGTFTPKWEGTDGLNPMDIASVKDWSDPLRADTLASAGLMVGRSGDVLDWEAFWVPKQTRSRLPGTASWIWPRHLNLPVRSDDLEIRLPDQVEYELDDRGELDRALGHNAGLRVQIRGAWADLSLAGFEGAAETPILQPVVSGTALAVKPPKDIILFDSPVHVRPIDYRRRTGAASFSLPLGTWIVRAAAKWDQPLGDSALLPGWSQQTVAGLEHTLEFGDQMVTLILQGAWGHSSSDESLLSISDLFDRATLGGVRWVMGEKTTLFVSGFRARDGSMFTQAELSRRWNDEWSTDLFAQFLDGSDEALLGLVRDRDRAGLRLVRAF